MKRRRTAERRRSKRTHAERRARLRACEEVAKVVDLTVDSGEARVVARVVAAELGPLTKAEVGALLRVTKQRIHQREEEILDRLWLMVEKA